MAHLWISGDGEPWMALVLEECAYDLDSRPPAKTPEPGPRNGQRHADDACATVLWPAAGPTASRWVLRVGSSRRVWVNGSRVDLGSHVLEDRDLVRLDTGSRFYFSTEEPVVVRPLFGGATMTKCPRCTREIEQGSLAVRCPVCDVWHHQNGKRDCWTYARQCANCDHTTDLDEAGFRWVPESI